MDFVELESEKLLQKLNFLLDSTAKLNGIIIKLDGIRNPVYALVESFVCFEEM